MRKVRFTEHQIIAVLKSVEAGRTVEDVCREVAIILYDYYFCSRLLSTFLWVSISNHDA